MSTTQAQMQRRLGRLDMLVEQIEKELGPLDERVRQAKREIELIKELSLRLVDPPRSSHARPSHLKTASSGG